MRHSIYKTLGLLVLVTCGMSSAYASRDALIEGARLCTQQFPLEERSKSIPTHLLAAIATTESGRWHKGLGMSVPWPWTINVEGKGYYFDSKAEAIARTQNLLAQGHNSIDVGCMQVNLKHHPKAFADLNQAFDPATNVAYSAKFLRNNYATLGDWIKATAAYHSRTQVYGQRYLEDIERSWNKIVGKVAAARAGTAGKPLEKTKVATNQRQPVMLNMGPKQPQRSKIIEVRDEPHRSSEVVVVRPEVGTTAAPAQFQPAAQPIPTSGNSIRRVTLDSATPSAVAKKPEPQFVFAN